VPLSDESHAGRYKANFTRCGLMIPESRVIAGLLLHGVAAGDWKQAITTDNVLSKRSVSTALTDATLIRGRLLTLPASLWPQIQDGSKPVATQAVLAGVINYSPLFGDFLDLVVRDLYRRLEPSMRPLHWDAHVEECRRRDPLLPAWSPSTLDKLRTRAFAMLAEAGFLCDTRTRALQRVQIYSEVARALTDAGQHETLRRLEVAEVRPVPCTSENP
jgi:hypothetical protein